MVAGCDRGSAGDTVSAFRLHTAALPRRWYFFVPQGVNDFQVVVRHGSAHRQDSGLMVMSPRGQRVAASFANRPRATGSSLRQRHNLTPKWDFISDEPQPQVLHIETDPGSTGRFWSIWACGGDGHWASDMPIRLDGIPPYFAPTPRQWFNPQTGRPPQVSVYDHMIGPIQRTSETICPPAPILGDTDTGMRGPHTVYLYNPENRPFDFQTSGYLHPPDVRIPVKYKVAGPAGQTLVEKEGSFKHFNPIDAFGVSVPASGAGVYRVEVDCPRWYGWSEPSMPMVLAGRRTNDGASRFSVDVQRLG